MAGKEIDLRGGARAWLAEPAHGSGPGLVLCHDGAAGMHELADLLAEEGYVVIAAKHADLGAQAAALRSLPNCKGRIGVLAFGRCAVPALQAAVRGEFDCAIAYCGSDTAPVLDAVRNIRIPVALHWTGDRRTESEPSENVESYAYSGVKPGFAVPGAPEYDKQSAAMAYSRTLALLRKVLGPHYDLSSLWEAHRACEFVTRDPEATMRTMVDEPYVNHIPTLTGGYGKKDLYRFYKHHFIPKSPKDMRNIPVSRTIGADRVVNEGVLCFTHDTEIDWMLPGVKPTGRYVEVPMVGVITFRGDKLCHEHIYWDQASVLVQIGLLDPAGLPVAGRASAAKVLDPGLPSNELMENWPLSAGKES
jgi:carboxymethylenebutenolidase